MFIKYAFGQQTAVLLRALYELVVRTLVSPTELAMWNLITIIANTVTLFQINVVAASNRLLTQLHGKKVGRLHLVSVRGNSIYIELFQQTILSCGLLLIAPIFWDAPEYLGFTLYYCAAAVMVSNGLIGLLVGLHESSSNFSRLGLLLPLNATIQAVFIICGVYFFGILGLISGAIFGLIFNVLMLFGSLRVSHIFWRTNPETTIVKDIGRIAVSFRLADLPTSAFYMLDIILASFLLEPKDLALYITARILVNFSTQIVFVLNRMGLVSLGNRIGAQQADSEISHFLSMQFVFVFLILLPLSVAIFEPVFRYALPIFLADYTESINALPFLLLAGATSSRSLFIRNYWIHKRQWKWIFYSGVWGLSMSLLIFWSGLEFFSEIGLREMAILTFLSQVPYALWIIVAVTISEDVKLHLLYRLGAFFLGLLSIILILQLNGALAETSIDSILTGIKEIGVGILIVVPSILIGWRMYRRSLL
jgi:hypothetical protein